MMTTVNTNISSTSVDDIAVLMMIMVDTGAGLGSRVGAGSLVMLSTGVVASEMVREGLEYKKITLMVISNAASVPPQN